MTEPLSESAELPLFPLGSVLFPGGLLPLQIFEPRYLDLIGRCQREGRPFGVVTLTRGHEVIRAPAPGLDEAGTQPAEAFEPVGALAHIVSLQRPQPGLMMIRCTGGQRFRLAWQRRLPHGLWLGSVAEWLPDDPSVPVPADLGHVRQALQDLLNHWATELERQALSVEELPIQGPHQLQDCGWLANRWCEMLPLRPAEKLRLMALDNPLLRLELVADILEQVHGLRRPDSSG